MGIDLTTPALLFPAISLLLLAYTNRFLAIAAVARQLHAEHESKPNKIISDQIENLRYRMILIRNMQALGILSLFFCVLCMFVIFLGKGKLGQFIFAISLLSLLTSLGISFREIQLSIKAIDLELSDMIRFKPRRKRRKLFSRKTTKKGK